jgi:recombination protein RecR
MFWEVRKYQKRIMLSLSIIMRCLTYGIRMGGDLEYAEEITLAKALEGRREV